MAYLKVDWDASICSLFLDLHLLLHRNPILLLTSPDDPPLILLSISNSHIQAHRKVLLVNLLFRFWRVVLNNLIDLALIVIIIQFVIVEILINNVINLPPDHLTASNGSLNVLAA